MQSTRTISRLLLEQSFRRFFSKWEWHSPEVLPGLCRSTDAFQLLQCYASSKESKEIPSYDLFLKLHFKIQFRSTLKLEYVIFLNLQNLQNAAAIQLQPEAADWVRSLLYFIYLSIPVPSPDQDKEEMYKNYLPYSYLLPAFQRKYGLMAKGWSGQDLN